MAGETAETVETETVETETVETETVEEVVDPAVPAPQLLPLLMLGQTSLDSSHL